MDGFLNVVLLLSILIILINHDGVTELDGAHVDASLHHLPNGGEL